MSYVKCWIFMQILSIQYVYVKCWIFMQILIIIIVMSNVEYSCKYWLYICQMLNIHANIEYNCMSNVYARNWICNLMYIKKFNMHSTFNNPLRPIGSPVTHESWPMNWPDFAASPARVGRPARSRHTLACMHRFSHIFRWPPEPAVWFMSEWRAVTNDQARI